MLRKPTDLGGLGVSVAGKVFWVDGIRKSCRQEWPEDRCGQRRTPGVLQYDMNPEEVGGDPGKNLHFVLEVIESHKRRVLS